MLKGYFTLKS